MPKYEVWATESVAFWAEIDAPDEEAAWRIATAMTWEDFSQDDSRIDWRVDEVTEVAPEGHLTATNGAVL